ncbi:MAG TPA: H-NS histone family protein [Bordetella sp.]
MDQQSKKSRRLAYAAQQSAIDKEISRLKKKAELLRIRRRKPIIAQIVGAMLNFDISPQDIAEAYRTGKDAKAANGKPKPGAGKLPPKYRHPETGETWSGRGKTPRWLREAESAGIAREAFFLTS